MTTSDSIRVAPRLFDPRFKYTPAGATNIAATWERFGFDPHANEQRRKQALREVAAHASDSLSPVI